MATTLIPIIILAFVFQHLLDSNVTTMPLSLRTVQHQRPTEASAARATSAIVFVAPETLKQRWYPHRWWPRRRWWSENWVRPLRRWYPHRWWPRRRWCRLDITLHQCKSSRKLGFWESGTGRFVIQQKFRELCLNPIADI